MLRDAVVHRCLRAMKRAQPGELGRRFSVRQKSLVGQIASELLHGMRHRADRYALSRRTTLLARSCLGNLSEVPSHPHGAQDLPHLVSKRNDDAATAEPGGAEADLE